MNILLDSANIPLIQTAIETINICGVTTNPSILAKEKEVRNFFDIIKQILPYDMELHVQVTGKTADEMCRQADRILNKIRDNIYIKVPVTVEGLKAIKIIKKSGGNVTGTAIMNVEQACLAGCNGADYVAPYVNRIHNLGQDPYDIISKMRKIFDYQKISTKILGASFHNTVQIVDAFAAGAHACTINPEMISEMCTNDIIKEWVSKFEQDWEKIGEPELY